MTREYKGNILTINRKFRITDESRDEDENVKRVKVSHPLFKE